MIDKQEKNKLQDTHVGLSVMCFPIFVVVLVVFTFWGGDPSKPAAVFVVAAARLVEAV